MQAQTSGGDPFLCKWESNFQAMSTSFDPQAIGPLQMGPYSYLKTPLPAAWAAC